MPKGGYNRGKGLNYQWLKDHLDFNGQECLLWPFSRNWNGYGMLGVEGKIIYAHRVMCKLVNGEPPTPKHIAGHSCHNGGGGCVHPKHLSWKTGRQNLLERREAGTNTKKRWNVNGTLTETQMQEICTLRGYLNQRQIADQFGITYQHVSAVQNGRVTGGIKFNALTPDQVRTIRKLKGTRTAKEFAKEYGVSRNAIYKMQLGISYRHVK